MLQAPWHRRLNSRSRLTHSGRRKRQSLRHRLTAERLEDRRLLAVVTWDGGGGNLNWNTAANWDTDTLPGPGDDVVIADVAPDISIFHSSGTTSINSLTSAESLRILGGTFEIADTSSIGGDFSLGSSSSARLSGSGDVTVGGLFTWTGGRMDGGGKLIANGGMLIQGSATKTQYRTIDNAGVATWTDGSIQSTAGVEFNNLLGATLDAQSDDQFGQSSSILNNAGTLLKSSGTGQSTFFADINNSGTVQVQTGTLRMYGGTNTGGFQIDAGATLRIAGRTQTFNSGWSVTGDGTFLVSGGTIDVASNGSIDAPLQLGSSGIITGTGDLDINRPFNWTGGYLRGTGQLDINTDTSIASGSSKYLQREINNIGTATWTGGTIYTNAAGVLNNSGTLIKPASTSTGTFTFNPVLNNTGTVKVEIGSLTLRGDGTSSGNFHVEAGAAVLFNSQTQTLNAGWSSTGPGRVRVIGTTLNVTASGNIEGDFELLYNNNTLLTGDGDVEVDGLFTWTGGRMEGNGTLIANGGMQVDGINTKYQDRTINNAGVATWTDGKIQASAGVVFHNMLGATLDAQSDDQFGHSSAILNNDGTIVKTAGTVQSTFFSELNNSGTVQVQSGTILLYGSSSSGAFQIDSGTTLRTTSRTHTLNPGWSVTGDGTFWVGGGTIDVIGGGGIDANLQLSSSGILTGTGDLDVNRPFTWSGGYLRGTGRLTIHSDMSISSGSSKYLQREINNVGTATWTGGTIYTNAAGVFNNFGSLIKPASTSTSTYYFNPALNNSGTLSVESGTLRLNGDGISNGNFHIGTNSRLQLYSQSQTLNAGWSVSGDGRLVVLGTRLDVVASGIVEGDLDLLYNNSTLLTGDGHVVVDGLFTWTGGRMEGAGTLFANGGMQIDGIYTKYQDRRIDNAGVATWTDGSIQASAGVEFNNLRGATLDAQSDDSFGHQSAILYNQGTLIKSAGSGQSTFFSDLNNNLGTVHVQSGTILLYGGTSRGEFLIDAGSTLRTTSRTLTLSPGWEVIGDGTFWISGGTVDLDFSGIMDANLLLSSSGVLTGVGYLDIDKSFNWTGGYLRGSGRWRVFGDMTLSGGSKYLQREIENLGTATWTGGTIYSNGNGVFNNHGTLIKPASTSTSTYYFNPVLNNSGSLHVESGTLRLNGDGTSNGNFHVEADGRLQFYSQDQTLNTGWTSTGPGTLSILGTTFDVAARGTVEGDFDLLYNSSTILTGDGDLEVDGLFTWTGGQMEGGGKLIANGGMLIEGTQSKYHYRTIDNVGVATWTDGYIQSSPGMVFNNLAGATLDAQSDDQFGHASATFNNAGILRKSAGTGQSTILSVIDNTGTVEVQSGTLSLSRGGSSSGNFQIGSSSAVRLASGTMALNSGWSVTGSGELRLTSGTLDATSDGTIESAFALGSSSGAILTGDGNVTLAGPFTWTGGRLRGTGALAINGDSQWGGSTKYIERTVDNAGTIDWTAGLIVANSAGALNNLSGATLDVQAPTTYSGSSSTFNNAGSLLASSTGRITFDTTIANTGTFDVRSGELRLNRQYTQTAGETILNGGFITNINPLEIEGGVLIGSGIVTGDVTNGGVTSPGLLPGEIGTIQVQGEFVQVPTVDAGGPYTVDEGGLVQLDATLDQSGGTLEIEIAALGSFDQLAAGGAVTLGAPLTVSLLGGYAPAVGDSFTILENNSVTAITGAFAGLPEAATFTVDSTQFQITYTGGANNNDVVLTVIDPILPDQGGNTLTFEWDLDGDGLFGETGSDAERGDEAGSRVYFSAENIEGPATLTVDVRAIDGPRQSAVATADVTVNDVVAIRLPDLSVSATDLTFSPQNPLPGETVTINATIKNQGLLDASNVTVEFFDFGVSIDQQLIANLASGGSEEVTLSATFPDDGFRLLTVNIDPANTIEELFEDNNEASQVIQIGVPDPTEALMVVHATEPQPVCKGVGVSIAGDADYEFETPPGTQSFPVQGARVSVTVIDPVTTNTVGVFAGSVTNGSGGYRQTVYAPRDAGLYTLRVQVTDNTVFGEFETTLEVFTDTECAEQPGPGPGPDPDPDPTLNLSLSPSSIWETDGSGAATATITRSNFEDLSSSLVVMLSSDDTSEATVPSQVTIPAGSASATFLIDAVDDAVNDGDRQVTITASGANLVGRATLTVLDDEADPRPTPPGTQDVRVFSEDILFSDENPDLNEPITILAYVHYFGSEPVTDPIRVTFNDIFPDEGALRVIEIDSTTISFPDADSSGPVAVAIPWTNPAEGAHLIQVVTDPPFEQATTANDEATRSIFVGSTLSQELTISYQDPPTLWLDADGNGAITPGDTLRYTIDYANTGVAAVTEAVIFDYFDESMVNDPVNISGGGTVSGGSVSWNIGSIAAGAAGSVTYDVVIKSAAELPSGSNLIANTGFLTSNETPSASDSVQIGVVLETTPPVTTATLSPAANAAGWNNTDVDLTLSAVDEPGGSGVRLIGYSIDGGDPVTAGGENVLLSFAEEGVHTVTYYAVDAAFNAETEQTIEIRIDKTAPLAVDDLVSVDEGGATDTLDGGSTSVLSNDSDTNLLTAELVDSPAFASSFSFDADGSFSYTHDGSENFSDSFSYRVSDPAGNHSTATVNISINPINEQPSITSDAAVEVNENQSSVIDVQSTDPDGETENGGGLSYSITGGADQAQFTIAGATGVLTFTAAPDFENPTDAGGDNVYELVVTVTDSGGLTDVQNIAVTVTDVNEAPSITSDAVINAAENQIAVIDVQSSDPDGESENGGGLTYSLTGGADQALLSINADTGVLTFNSAPDFESPADAGGDNVYNVQVTVTDAGGLTDVQELAVNVTDVNEAPAITSVAAVDAAENQTSVIDVQSTDPDGETENGGGLTYSLTGGADQALFLIDPNTGVVAFAAAPDFEAPIDAGGDNVYDLQITVTDAGGLDGVQNLAVTVVNVNEPPSLANPIADVEANEDAADDQLDLSATFIDPDFADPLTLSVVGNTDANLVSATFNGSQLTLDYLADQNGSTEITVRATDGGGLFVEDTFTVVVLSAGAQLQNLIVDVANLGLEEGDANKLSKKLENGIKKIDEAKLEQSIKEIEKFIKEVDKLFDKGKLSGADAEALIAAANVAINSAMTVDIHDDGTTSLIVVERGDQLLEIVDAADPTEGFLIKADPSGGNKPAIISACGDSAQFRVDAGDQFVVTCGSVAVQVIGGSVESTFWADDGTAATAQLAAGNGLFFQTTDASFTTSVENTDTVLIAIDDALLLLAPDESLLVEAIDRQGLNDLQDDLQILIDVCAVPAHEADKLQHPVAKAIEDFDKGEYDKLAKELEKFIKELDKAELLDAKRDPLFESANRLLAGVSLAAQQQAQSTERLVAEVETLIELDVLSGREADRLLREIERAVKEFEKWHFHHAIDKIEKFIEGVRDLISESELASEDGQPLIDAANQIIAAASPTTPAESIESLDLVFASLGA